MFESLIFIGAGAMLAGSLIDWHSSKDFRLFGQTERTGIFRDEHGFFSSRKYWLASCGLIVTYLAGAFLAQRTGAPPLAGIFILLGGVAAGFVRARQGWKNLAGAKRNRARQIAHLEFPASYADGVRRATSGIWFGTLFSFFSSKADDEHRARIEIDAKIAQLALKPLGVRFESGTIARIENS